MLSSNAMIVIAVVVYVIWLAIYVLLIDRLLRFSVSRLFGVTITRKWAGYPSSQVSLLDIFAMFSWQVVEPSSWILRFAIGFIRVTFWAIALISPLVLAFASLDWLKHHVAK
jgi:hypothetical protein